MKFRLDFVTNSSSSSYICDVCECIESGWDLSLEDAEMYQCSNDHVFCKDHIVKELPEEKELVIATLKDRITNPPIWRLSRQDYIEADKASLNTLLNGINEFGEAMDDDEMSDLISDLALELDIYYRIPQEFCPICTMESVTCRDREQYLLRYYERTSTEIDDEIRKNFLSFEDFMKYNKGKERE